MDQEILLFTQKKKLDKNERVLEVARMLSGAQLTPEAIANAESLISQS